MIFSDIYYFSSSSINLGGNRIKDVVNVRFDVFQARRHKFHKDSVLNSVQHHPNVPKFVKVSDKEIYLVLFNLTTTKKNFILVSDNRLLHNFSDVGIYSKPTVIPLWKKGSIIKIQQQLQDDNVYDLNLTYRLNTDSKLKDEFLDIINERIKVIDNKAVLYEPNLMPDDVFNLLKNNKNIVD